MVKNGNESSFCNQRVPVWCAPTWKSSNTFRVGETNAPKHQQNENSWEQSHTKVDSWIVPKVHEECTDSEAFDDSNNDEDCPNRCEGYRRVGSGPFFEEYSPDLKQCEDHQYDKIPEVDVLAHD